jgi:hypothetical protein
MIQRTTISTRQRTRSRNNEARCACALRVERGEPRPSLRVGRRVRRCACVTRLTGGRTRTCVRRWGRCCRAPARVTSATSATSATFGTTLCPMSTYLPFWGCRGCRLLCEKYGTSTHYFLFFTVLTADEVQPHRSPSWTQRARSGRPWRPATVCAALVRPR